MGMGFQNMGGDKKNIASMHMGKGNRTSNKGCRHLRDAAGFADRLIVALE